MSPGWGRQIGALRRDPSVTEHRIAPGTGRRVLAWAGHYRWLLALFGLLILLGSAVEVVPPLLFRSIIDDGVIAGDGGVVVASAVILAVLAVGDFALALAQRWCSARVGEGLIRDLRVAVFEHMASMSLAFFARSHTGKLVSRISSDVLGAQRTFTSTFSTALSSVARLVLVLAAMLSLSPLLTVLSLALLPIFLIPARLVGRRLASLSLAAANLNGDISATMTERFSVSGALLVKLFGDPQRERDGFADTADRLRHIGVDTALVSRFFVASMALVSALATALVYGIGGMAAVGGQMSIGTLTALVALLAMLYSPLIALTNLRVDIMSALVSFERVFEVLDLTPGITEAPDARPIDEPATVEFRDVEFTYPRAQDVSLASLEPVGAQGETDSAPVLRGVSLVAAEGSTVALVGQSGAGKTTITHLIARLYDVTGGAVLVGGVDVRDATARSLQDHLGYVTQDAHMFHASVRDNLAYAAPDADEAAMWRALTDAQIDDLVRRLPDGLDTVVGDRGYRLSGGERQRMAIARLLLKDPPIVVLDEATAHLDSEAEAAVQRALAEAMRGRTTIVIAHRLSTVRDADQILVVGGGEIVERGTHDELVAAGGAYAELYRTQFSSERSE